MNMRAVQYNNRSAILIIAVVFASFIINLFIKSGLNFEYLCLQVEEIKVISDSSYLSLMLYVLIKRIKQAVLVVILMRVIKPDIVYNAIIVLLSGMLGILLTVQTYYAGIAGVFLLILYIIPHYIVYIILIKYIYDHYLGNLVDIGKTKFFLITILLLLIGVLCEGVFSRFFLNKFYQYMVIG